MSFGGFNENLAVSCNSLPLYDGEMTLVPHQGEPCTGSGSLILTCGPVMRHIQVMFTRSNGLPLPNLRGSGDGRYGAGTSMMRLPHSDDFFVFVTSGLHSSSLVGEARLITGHSDRKCARISVYLMNCLIPESDATWIMGDWAISLERTACAYSLSRVSLPAHEINLTHTLTVRRADGHSVCWNEVEATIDRFLTFLSFVNCSRVSGAVVYGYSVDGSIESFRLQKPRRALPTNRRTWATGLGDNRLQQALSLYLCATEESFSANIFARAVEWQILAETALYNSPEQALFTVQMLLEMLSFVVLVEEAQILGEDGYAKLPASDRITLLCGHTGQSIALDFPWNDELSPFCESNSINNVGELITALRNKLIHPTKRNREYLDRVPQSIRVAAIYAGIQIASLVLLKAIRYKDTYFDIVHHEKRTVPWV